MLNFFLKKKKKGDRMMGYAYGVFRKMTNNLFQKNFNTVFIKNKKKLLKY